MGLDLIELYTACSVFGRNVTDYDGYFANSIKRASYAKTALLKFAQYFETYKHCEGLDALSFLDEYIDKMLEYYRYKHAYCFKIAVRVLSRFRDYLINCQEIKGKYGYVDFGY